MEPVLRVRGHGIRWPEGDRYDLDNTLILPSVPGSLLPFSIEALCAESPRWSFEGDRVIVPMSSPV